MEALEKENVRLKATKECVEESNLRLRDFKIVFLEPISVLL